MVQKGVGIGVDDGAPPELPLPPPLLPLLPLLSLPTPPPLLALGERPTPGKQRHACSPTDPAGAPVSAGQAAHTPVPAMGSYMSGGQAGVRATALPSLRFVTAVMSAVETQSPMAVAARTSAAGGGEP